MCVFCCVLDSISEWQTCVASKERARRMRGERERERERERPKVLDELITGIGHGITHEFATFLRANESERGKPTTHTHTHWHSVCLFRHPYNYNMYVREKLNRFFKK